MLRLLSILAKLLTFDRSRIINIDKVGARVWHNAQQQRKYVVELNDFFCDFFDSFNKIA